MIKMANKTHLGVYGKLLVKKLRDKYYVVLSMEKNRTNYI